MLIFPTEPADAHLSRRFDDWNMQDLAADFSARRFALLPGEIDESLIGDRFDETVSQQTERKAERADRFRHWNSLLDFLVRKRAAGTDSTIIHERPACYLFCSVSDRDCWSAEASISPQMAYAQFRDLGAGT